MARWTSCEPELSKPLSTFDTSHYVGYDPWRVKKLGKRTVEAGLGLALVLFVAVAFLGPREGIAWARGANAGTLATLYAAGLTIAIFAWTRDKTDESSKLMDAVKRAADNASKAAKAAHLAASSAEDAARAAEDAALKASTDTQKMLDQLSRATLADVVGTQDDVEQDPSLEASPEHAKGIIITPDGKQLSLFPREEVPLRVIAELVQQWEQDGLGGRYRVEDVAAGARVTGKGNNPWLVQFESEPPGIWWKVSFGGKAKTGGTVTKLDLSVDDEATSAT